MTDVLKRLGGPVALTTSAATVYTVPAATVAAVTNIHVANESTSSATFTLSVGTNGAGKAFVSGVAVSPGDVFDWSGTLVLTAAEIVQALASAGTALTLTMSGVESA